MLRSDFHYRLPDELIARHPPAVRSAARLLHLRPGGALDDRRFVDLPTLFGAGDLFVFNRTRVIPARLQARKPSGGRVEILIERVIDDHVAVAQLRASKKPRPDTVLVLEDDTVVTLASRENAMWRLRFDGVVSEVLNRLGHTPLPPYIDRPDEAADRERYQTIYADRPGAVAAPTAGLHFDQALMDRLQRQGIETAFLTLHVGAGTFQPVRVEDLNAHRMHGERFVIEPSVVDAVARTRRRGGRIVAIGTTTVRALESAADNQGQLSPMDSETQLFIQPGFRFRVVDALITNFHLPESTLLMLVCAFAGYDEVLRAYAHAVRERYRFFSYGDAMLMHRCGNAV